jgi:hypothetical protein
VVELHDGEPVLTQRPVGKAGHDEFFEVAVAVGDAGAGVEHGDGAFEAAAVAAG